MCLYIKTVVHQRIPPRVSLDYEAFPEIRVSGRQEKRGMFQVLLLIASISK